MKHRQKANREFIVEQRNTIRLGIISKIIIWKAQGVPQLNNVAHPKHLEEEETSPNRNHIITGKQQQTN